MTANWCSLALHRERSTTAGGRAMCTCRLDSTGSHVLHDADSRVDQRRNHVVSARLVRQGLLHCDFELEATTDLVAGLGCCEVHTHPSRDNDYDLRFGRPCNAWKHGIPPEARIW